jgi:hypothetical protein
VSTEQAPTRCGPVLFENGTTEVVHIVKPYAYTCECGAVVTNRARRPDTRPS